MTKKVLKKSEMFTLYFSSGSTVLKQIIAKIKDRTKQVSETKTETEIEFC